MQAPDPPITNIEDGEVEPHGRDLIAGDRELGELRDDEAAERLHLRRDLGEDETELARGDVEREPPVDVEAAVGVAPDGRNLLGVLLVLNLTDDLLDEIFERDDPGEGVARAEDDGDVHAAPLELAP